jgi:MSHA biogenesis protein MshO
MFRRSGFTLIEFIMTIIIIGIVAATCVPIVVNGLKAYNDTLYTAAALDKLRYATERIAREVRESTAGSLNMSTTAPSFTRTDYMGALTSGTNTCGATCTLRTVSITRNTSTGIVTLSYSTPSVSPTPTLMDGMSSSNPLTFAYFDSTNTATTVAGSVKYVVITVGVTVNGQEYTQRTRVALRNQ